MLIKLLPSQTAKIWDIVRFCYLRSLPPGTSESSEAVQGVLHSLLLETSQCWVGLDKTEADVDNQVYVVLLSKIIIDEVTQERNLCLYTIFGFRPIPDAMWEQGIESLKAFAKANRCTYITSLSAHPKVMEVCQRLGFVSTRLLSLEV